MEASGIKCPKCLEGPLGPAGHEDLFTHSFIADSHVLLKCRTCGSFWSREARRDQTYAWSAATHARGVMVPQRS